MVRKVSGIPSPFVRKAPTPGTIGGLPPIHIYREITLPFVARLVIFTIFLLVFFSTNYLVIMTDTLFPFFRLLSQWVLAR